MRFLPLAFVMAAFRFSALADDGYCPLHVGDEWTYTIAFIEPKGPVSVVPDHSRIRGTSKRSGKTYFAFEQWGKDPAEKETTSYVRKDKKGVHTTFERAEKGAEVLWLSFPLKIGATWKYDAEMTCTVLGWENVTIGTMTYKNCCHVVTKMADGSFTRDEWLAPSIGLVKSEDVVAVGPKRTKTLVEFKPSK